MVYQRRNNRVEAARMRRYIESAGRRFPDLVPPRGAGKQVREWCHTSSLLRRIRIADEAGMLKDLDPELQRTIRAMEGELMERMLKAMQ